VKALDALETVVRPSLAEVLGQTVSSLVISRSFGMLVKLVKGGGTEAEHFKVVVDELCRDSRLVAAFGGPRLEQMKRTWIKRAE
jgi:hypothetical protein